MFFISRGRGGCSPAVLDTDDFISLSYVFSNAILVDGNMAITMRNAVESQIGSQIPIFEAMSRRTIAVTISRAVLYVFIFAVPISWREVGFTLVAAKVTISFYVSRHISYMAGLLRVYLTVRKSINIACQ